MSIGTAVAYVGRLFQFQTTVGFILVTVIVALLAESAAIDKSPIDMNTPGLFEPPVRSLRATIPDAGSHQEYYSTVLLTRASTAYNFCGKRASPLPTAGLPRRISLSYAYSCKEPFAA
jgi:hypothetical protein